MIITSDNLTALKEMPDQSVDLVYADPPFNTKRDFGSSDGGFSDKPPETTELPPDWAWLQEISPPSDIPYYADKLPRLIELRRVLKSTGSLYWHIDRRTSHVYRSIFNRLFGYAAFRNEIIWKYEGTFNKTVHKWRDNFDCLLFYANSEHSFNTQYLPLTPRQIRERYKYKDSDGNFYRYLGDRGDGYHNKIRIYLENDKGSMISACWTDIKTVKTKERVGYPTQKPLALLYRILKASTKAGETVLDPYCGSGTTLLAAKHLKRNYIGIDVNEEATAIARKRCEENANGIE